MVVKEDMGNNTHQALLERIPAYALGALDAEERDEVEQHLAGCRACRAELRAYQRVTDLLSLAAPEAEPDAGLRGELLARVAELRAGGVGTSAPAPSLLDRLRASVRVPVWQLAAALILVAALVAGGLSLDLGSQPAFYQVALSAPSGSPNADGLLVIADQGEVGTLVVENLPVLDAASQYQFWLIEADGSRISGGLFDVHENGYQSLVVYLPEPFDAYTSFGVTVEPSGGSPGPTSDPVLVSQ
jgi:anti-sigma-K factor RskA